MDEFMTIEEIREQFVSEWILVENPELAENLEVKGGKVVWHSPDRDAVYRKLRELGPSDWAVLYTGEIPADAAVML
ncbi:MAG: hypothetical protein HY332_01235 [Chloroflexi bacterium]|nr:hypothetical protein [Chloroflexota bacterium]